MFVFVFACADLVYWNLYSGIHGCYIEYYISSKLNWKAGFQSNLKILSELSWYLLQYNFSLISCPSAIFREYQPLWRYSLHKMLLPQTPSPWSHHYHILSPRSGTAKNKSVFISFWLFVWYYSFLCFGLMLIVDAYPQVVLTPLGLSENWVPYLSLF